MLHFNTQSQNELTSSKSKKNLPNGSIYLLLDTVRILQSTANFEHNNKNIVYSLLCIWNLFRPL